MSDKISRTMIGKRIILAFAAAVIAFSIAVSIVRVVRCGNGTPVAVNVLDRQLVKFLTSDRFEKFTVSTLGRRMELVSFIIVGSRDQLDGAFNQAGWSAADPWGVGTTLRLAAATLLNRAYATAPITPSCYQGTLQSLAFEKPTDANTARQRHHIRFWSAGFTVDGVPAWVGTASFDKDSHYLIAHRISPTIDAERDFISVSVLGARLQDSSLVPLLPGPVSGTNQGGDSFVTDGRALLVHL